MICVCARWPRPLPARTCRVTRVSAAAERDTPVAIFMGPVGAPRMLVAGKLRVPASPGRLLSRPRVEGLLAAMIERYRAVFVIATAGAGKTTALVQAAKLVDRPLAWVRAWRSRHPDNRAGDRRRRLAGFRACRVDDLRVDGRPCTRSGAGRSSEDDRGARSTRRELAVDRRAARQVLWVDRDSAIGGAASARYRASRAADRRDPLHAHDRR